MAPPRASGLWVCIVLAQALPVAGSDCQITDLGPGRAKSINNNGQVVGDPGNGVDGQGGVGTASNQGFYFDGSSRFPLTFSAVTISGLALSGIATDALAINDAGVVLLHQAPISFFSYSIVRTSATSGAGLGDRGDGYRPGNEMVIFPMGCIGWYAKEAQQVERRPPNTGNDTAAGGWSQQATYQFPRHLIQNMSSICYVGTGFWKRP